MATDGLFDPEIDKRGVFDPEHNRGGLFDPELIKTSSGVVLTPLTWLGTYADLIPTPRRVAWSQAFAMGQPFADVTSKTFSWKAAYPDTAPGARRPPEFPAYTSGSRLDMLTAKTLAWQAKYPDQMMVPRIPAWFKALGSFGVPFNEVTAKTLSWQAEYPDAVRLPAFPHPPSYTAPVTTPTAGFDPSISTFQWEYQDVLAARVPTQSPSIFSPVTVTQIPTWFQPLFVDLAPGPRPALPGWLTQALAPSYPIPSLPGWLANYVDTAPKARTPLESWPAFVTGSTSSSLPVAALAWAAKYPDSARAARTPVEAWPAWVTGATSSTFTVPAVSWAAKYADSARAARTPIESWPSFAALHPQPISITLDQFAWRGSYPDKFTYLRPPDLPAWATGATSSTFTVPSRSWAGVYADKIDAAPRVWVPPFTALDAFPRTEMTPLSWRGQYADWVDRLRAMPLSEARAPFAPTNPVTALSWKGIYADRAPGARPLADWQTLAFYPVPFAQPLNTFGWRGSYPDWFQYLRPAEFPAWTTGALSPALPVPRPLAWQPLYPSRVDVAKGVVAPPFLALDAFPRPGLIPLSWQGVYADKVDRLSLPMFGWTASPSSLLLPSPMLAWQGVYPERVWPKARLLDALQRFWQSSTSVVNPVPSRAWAGVYPDRIVLSRARLLDGSQKFWTYSTSSIYPVPLVSWRGFYPSGFPHPVLASIPMLFAAPYISDPGASIDSFPPTVFYGPELIRFMSQLALQPRTTLETIAFPSITSDTTTQPSFGPRLLLTLPPDAPSFEAVVTNGASSLWRLDESAGPTIRDSIDTRPGVVAGNVIFNQPGLIGPLSRAISLDGLDTSGPPRILVSNGTIGGLSALSLEAWIKPSTVSPSDYPNTNKLIIGYWSDSFLKIQVNSATTRFFVARIATTGGVFVAVSGSPQANTIYHLVMTYDGQNLVLYIDGVETARTPATGLLIATGGQSFSLGGIPTFGFAGLLGPCARYETALTAVQVLSNYNAGHAVSVPLGNIKEDATVWQMMVNQDMTHPSFGSRAHVLGLSTTSVAHESVARSAGAIHYWHLDEPNIVDRTILSREVLDSIGTADGGVVTSDDGSAVYHGGIIVYGQPGLMNDGRTSYLITGGEMLNGANDSSGTAHVHVEGALAEVDGTASVTCEVWIRPQVLAADSLFFAGGLSLKIHSGQANVQLNTSNGLVDVVGGSVVINQTYQIVATYDGVTARLYVNGIQVGQQNFIGAINCAGDTHVTIGGTEGGGTVYDGWVEKTVIYPTALTPQQIAALYAARIVTAVPVPPATNNKEEADV